MFGGKMGNVRWSWGVDESFSGTILKFLENYEKLLFGWIEHMFGARPSLATKSDARSATVKRRRSDQKFQKKSPPFRAGILSACQKISVVRSADSVSSTVAFSLSLTIPKKCSIRFLRTILIGT